MFLLALTIVFLLCYALLFGYYRRGWKQLPEFKQSSEDVFTRISVIVPARNEAQNIGRLLHSLQQQHYPKEKFEIIVVDDHSEDDTAAVVRSYGVANLQLIQPAADAARSSKKKAIEAGVRQASGLLIVTTDADCRMEPSWLSTLNRFYLQTGAKFIAAPVKITGGQRAVEVFQILDFMMLQGITAASVAANFHTMCNGANLAYEKAAFEAVGGFEGIDRVATGDDLLLMYKIWKRYPDKVFYLKSRGATVETAALPSWKALLNQRRRWASKTLVYDDFRIIAALGFVFLFNLLFIALVIAALVSPFYWYAVLLYLAVKCGLELSFIYPVARFFGQQKLLRYMAVFQPVHVAYVVAVALISQFGKYEWKGRRTR